MPVGVYKRTPEHNRKNAEAKRGRKLSEEHKRKISLGLIGRIVSPETRAKISASNMGKKMPEEVRLKLTGANCHLWRGGITPAHKAIRMSIHTKRWRQEVFERDSYTCLECGTRSGGGKRVDLNADHIKSFSQYPELRFDLSNGRTLCVPCHRKTPNYGGKSIKSYASLS